MVLSHECEHMRCMNGKTDLMLQFPSLWLARNWSYNGSCRLCLQRCYKVNGSCHSDEALAHRLPNAVLAEMRQVSCQECRSLLRGTLRRAEPRATAELLQDRQKIRQSRNGALSANGWEVAVGRKREGTRENRNLIC